MCYIACFSEHYNIGIFDSIIIFTIIGRAVRTSVEFSTLFVDLLSDGFASSGRESGSLDQVQKHLTIHRGEQHPAAGLWVGVGVGVGVSVGVGVGVGEAD